MRAVEEITATFSLDDPSIGPLEVPLLQVASGHHSAYGFELPLPGLWRLDVVVRTSDIDQYRVTTTVPIR